MINKTKVFGMLGLCTKAGKTISGTDICVENIEKKKISLVIIAEDASDRTKSKFEELCKKHNVAIIVLGNIDELSKCIGKKNKAVIGVKDKNFANEIKKIVDGGDIIG